MKKIFALLIAVMAFVLPSFAQSSNSKPKNPIHLEPRPEDAIPNPTIHRAPVHISVEAWYDEDASTISIAYNGESSGEAVLYRDGQRVDSSSEINTSFPVFESGFYTIEITTESWTATGSIEI